MPSLSLAACAMQHDSIDNYPILFLSRLWSFYAISKVSYVLTLTTVTRTATSIIAGPVLALSVPSNSCMETQWTLFEKTAHWTVLQEAKSRKKWVNGKIYHVFMFFCFVLFSGQGISIFKDCIMYSNNVLSWEKEHSIFLNIVLLQKVMRLFSIMEGM